MGMPAVVYRGFYFSHALTALRRNILSFVGIGPTRSTIVGNVESISDDRCRRWLDKVTQLGRDAR